MLMQELRLYISERKPGSCGPHSMQRDKMIHDLNYACAAPVFKTKHVVKFSKDGEPSNANQVIKLSFFSTMG